METQKPDLVTKCCK